MAIFDITIPFSPATTSFPGDPDISVTPVQRIAAGDPCNLSALACATHSGTHIDAPRHFFDNGTTVDRIPLELLMGEAYVADMTGCPVIGSAELERLQLSGLTRLLVKTVGQRFRHKGTAAGDSPFLTPDAARMLVNAGVRLVGIDTLSVERSDGDGEVHRLLLGHGGVVVECLDLSEVPEGSYHLICLPLRIENGDGSPVRALLMKKEPTPIIVAG